ncbi:MAG: polyketide synthase dehydratase domain-containing protein, partial [Williamsia herbipolensis]|nr:polyketide synthase dehydratase domain-containing protein [Williamsia herbipolensis]
ERSVTVLRTMDGVTTRHAQGTVLVSAEPAPRIDLPTLLATTLERDAATSGLFRGQSRTSVVTFGPRWDVLQHHHIGAGVEIAALELGAPTDAPDDAEHWFLQPALLDVATAFSERGEGSYLPIGYGEVTAWGPLPDRFHSVLHHSGDAGEVVAADLELVDPDGAVVVRIKDFALRRIDPDAVTGGDTPADATRPTAAPRATTLHRVTSGTPAVRIGSADGATAFRLLAGSELGPTVVVNPTAVVELLQQIRSGQESIDTPQAGSDVGVGVSAGGTAAVVAGVWSAVLGVPDVSADDDFFALGGNSLVAVQLIGQIRKAVGVRLPMRIIFDAPTVQEMADAVDEMKAAVRPESSDAGAASEESGDSERTGAPDAMMADGDDGRSGTARPTPPADDPRSTGAIPRLARPGT